VRGTRNGRRLALHMIRKKLFKSLWVVVRNCSSMYLLWTRYHTNFCIFRRNFVCDWLLHLNNFTSFLKFIEVEQVWLLTKMTHPLCYSRNFCNILIWRICLQHFFLIYAIFFCLSFTFHILAIGLSRLNFKSVLSQLEIHFFISLG